MSPQPNPAPAPYVPQFDSTLYVTCNGQFCGSINPVYCLDESSVPGLLALLAPLKPTEVHGPPLGSMTGPFAQSGQVPFLLFPNGETPNIEINAGLLANYWNHGYPPTFALSQCLADLENNWGVTAGR